MCGPPTNPTNPSSTRSAILDAGGRYYVGVRAVNDSGPGRWSESFAAATEAVAPGAPVITGVVRGNRVLLVAWDAPAEDGGEDITSYDLRYIETSADETVDANWTVKSNAWTPGSGSLDYRITGLEIGTEYDMWVRAVNSVGPGDWSAPRMGAPLAVPGAPTISSVTAGLRELIVEWAAPLVTGGADITGYDVRYMETAADGSGGCQLDRNEARMDLGIVAVHRHGARGRHPVRRGGSGGEQGRCGPVVGYRDGNVGAFRRCHAQRSVPGGCAVEPRVRRGCDLLHGVGGLYGEPGHRRRDRQRRTGRRWCWWTATATSSTDADEFANGFQVDLPVVGENVVGVWVTAQDGSTRTYEVTVTRTPEDLSLSPPGSDPAAPFPSTATYSIGFQGRWTTDVTPDRRPGGAHFSRLVGGVHNAGVTLLRSGHLAGAGVESMAETGDWTVLRDEVNNAGEGAIGVLVGTTDRIGPTATRTLSNVAVTTSHPRVTLTTMIAPSHDWFVAVSGLPLLDGDGLWRRSHMVDLYPWDAGTEEGIDFALTPDVDTVPRGVITSIRGTGRFTTDPIATLTFTLGSANTGRGLAENTRIVTDLGPPVAAVATGGTPTYTLGGPDADLFDLDGSTGRLRSKTGVVYDHETAETRTVTVTATDTDGSIPTTVEIAITNVDEGGTVSLSSVQPQVGTELGAVLSDPDGSVRAVTWVWERRRGTSGAWSTIVRADGDAYTPVGDDERYFLRVTASYSDREGSGKTAEAASTNEVQEAPPEPNTAPYFPSSETGRREVEENTPAGEPVGEAVEATDDNAGDTLTYRLDGGTDGAAFEIDELSGQLRTRAALNYEGKRSYSMRLTVTDPSGADDSITVRVAVTNVDEPLDLSGAAEVDYEENRRDMVASYRAVDPEGASVVWTLAGDDRDVFEISRGGVLTFGSPPDYEAPTGSGGNNTYLVTVEASDGTYTPTPTQAVTVSVTNVEEEGTVTLTPARPEVGVEISADLKDPDRGVSNQVWRWERSENNRNWTPIPGAEGDSYTPTTADRGHYLQVVVTYHDGEGPAKDAAAATSGRVPNPTRPPPPPPPSPPPSAPPSPPPGPSSGPGPGPSGGGGPEPLPPGANHPPEFSEGSRTVRTVAENSPAGTDIGGPVTAVDPEDDPLAYKLAGSSADSFDLDTATGQLKTKAALDYESRNSYTVTVEVRDGKNPEGEADRRRDDSIRVTIMVGNRDDPGWVTLSAPTPRRLVPRDG